MLAFGLSVLSILSLGHAKVVRYDDIAPFAQPVPVTITEKRAVEFKPQVHTNGGCYPYPVVDKDGNTGDCLASSGPDSKSCNGPSVGSQVYGRAKRFTDKWAIMYAWYLPKNSNGWGIESRHLWLETIVWLDSFVLESPTILAVTTWHQGKYQKYLPPVADTLNGTSVKLDCTNTLEYGYMLDVTNRIGETQDLIMWNQLTDAARSALQWTDFNGLSAPISDGRFEELLEKANK
ncbi:hypothetical protein L915_09012 [Phytophthora nicotianae]|uniref:Necrosis inducing-like protein NPP1 type n=2 Tax=Phytophthora nicotianae TaxID=4792 RepID=W2GVM2_PHYNI|nr:hypothetical protein L915_09012 [Phytophthora nicotianae]